MRIMIETTAITRSLVYFINNQITTNFITIETKLITSEIALRQLCKILNYKFHCLHRVWIGD